ncbi:MAG: hypothetical protein Q8L24_00560 [bacterium]|nr:hypothetical protein [bacterium]
MNKIKLLVTAGLSMFALSAMAAPILIAPKSTAVTEPIEVKEATQIGGDTVVPKNAAQGDDGAVSADLQKVGGKAEYESFTATNNADSQKVLPTVNKRTASVIVRGWDAEKKELVDVLEKNAKATAEADENIVSAEVDKDKIEVIYRRPAKLFGFIPVAYYHAFTVDGKGNISNGKPWWLMFASGDADQFGSDVDALFQDGQSKLRYIKAPTDLEQQLQRFSALSNILKTKHDTVKNSINNVR